jgi:hypothetical protein
MDAAALSRDALTDFVVSQRGYTALGLLLRAVRALVPARGLMISSTLAHDPFDLLARDMPPLRCIAFTPCIDERVEAIGRIDRTVDATFDTSIELADVDLDLQCRASSAPFGVSRAGIGLARKARRLDSLFGSHVSARQRVDAIIIRERSARALRILQGSERVLATDRPVVVLALGQSPEASSAIDLLAANGYQFFDQFLWAGAAPFAHGNDLEKWVLAISREGATSRMARALFQDVTPEAADAAAWNRALLQRFRIEAQAGGIRFDLCTAPGELVIPVGCELARWGFHASESSEDMAWSWMGPRPRAGLVLPALASRLETIQLRVIAAVDPRNVEELRASIDGTPARVRARWHVDQGHIDITPSVPVDAGSPFHVLELSCPKTLRPNEAESRLLALAFSTATLRSLAG